MQIIGVIRTTAAAATVIAGIAGITLGAAPAMAASCSSYNACLWREEGFGGDVYADPDGTSSYVGSWVSNASSSLAVGYGDYITFHSDDNYGGDAVYWASGQQEPWLSDVYAGRAPGWSWNDEIESHQRGIH
jgi:hypothetical protein